MADVGDTELHRLPVRARIADVGAQMPATTVLDNPCTYTQWDAGSAQWKGGASDQQ
jgi:hypothetical protein